MASTISAGTTAGTAIAIAGDTTGNLAFQTSAGTYTQTMPNATGTIMVSGNIPAFLVTPSTTQTISHNTQTKVTLGTELYDTANCFASSTFTPNVAGYYQVNYNLAMANTSGRNYYFSASVYKNGTAYATFEWTTLGNAGGRFTTTFGSLIPMNGSTDTIEFYIFSYDYTASSSVNVNTNSQCSAFLARSL
jgi:hypothetical protein